MAQIDQQVFRDGQRNNWDEASAGWREWSEFIDRSTRSVSERLVAMAGVEPGHRVLDVAAGYGEPSLTAARIVGPEGERRRDRHLGGNAGVRSRTRGRGRLQNIEFIESDAASLDFPPSSFDAALSRWGIIFEPDGEAAAAASEASSSRARGWRSAPGDRPSASRSSRSRWGR